VENIILPTNNIALNNIEIINRVKQQLNNSSWVLLCDLDTSSFKFSPLLKYFCSTLTFDLAHKFIDETCQKVNAGTEPIGLHIENNSSPFPFNLITFYSIKITK
jgi:hypothetical protein